MVVTLGAADGETEKDGTDGCRHFAEHLMAGGIATRFGERGQAQKGQRDGGLRLWLRKIARAHDLFRFIARDLLDHEFVVRLVLVEGVDDIVPIAPGIRQIGIPFVAGGVGITGEVEPETRPTLTVARVGQEFVHELFISLGIWIIDERVHLGGRWRQTYYIEIESPDEGASGCCWREHEAVFLECCENEVVDPVGAPVVVLDNWGRESGERGKWPDCNGVRC